MTIISYNCIIYLILFILLLKRLDRCQCCQIGYDGNPCQPLYNIAFNVSYSGGNQSYLVPSTVNVLFVKLWGAGGGGSNWNEGGVFGGGAGGYTSCYLSVTPGEELLIIVGGGGQVNCSIIYLKKQ